MKLRKQGISLPEVYEFCGYEVSTNPKQSAMDILKKRYEFVLKKEKETEVSEEKPNKDE